MNSEQLDPEKDPSRDGKTGGIYQYVGRDEYGLSLHYFQGDYQSISSGDDFLLEVPGAYYGGYDLYNGNIRAMNNALRTGGTSEPLLQVFGYDQLNRIGSSRSYIQNALAASITDWNPSAPVTDMFHTLYSYDANGNIQELHRYDKAGVQFDRLSYGYTAGTNRLDYVNDAIADGVVNYDIDNNDPGNYGYDAIGNLTRDVKEEIGNIGWNVYGKVVNVIRSGGSSRPDLYFDYNPAGQRIFKLLQPQADLFSWENYVLDAQGNVLAVYAMREGSDTIVLKQNMLYGSSRLGLWERNKKLTFTPVTETIQSVHRGDKRYELSDHLGNVHVVLTDRKELHCGLEDNVPFPEYYTTEVKNRYDYYPFGMLMEERKYSGPNCIYDRDSTLTMYSQDLSFDEDPMDWYYINEQDNPGIDGNGNMVLDRDQNTLLRLITPTEAGQQYRVRFGIDLNGCDSVLVAGNLQNATTQYINSSGDHTFYFTSNDDTYSSFGFYLDFPCQVLISYVIIEALDVSSTVVCDSNATLAYRYGFNGQMKDDEVYGVEGTSYTAEYWQYDSRLGRRWNVDPMTGEKPWLSPYHAFSDNPIVNIDLNGAFDHDYGVDKNGKAVVLRYTNDNFDRLYSVDENGKVKDEDNFVQVTDRILLPELSKLKAKKTLTAADGGVIDRGELHYASSQNKEDVVNLFQFVAKNTNFEWAVYSTKDQNYTIGTYMFNNLSPNQYNLKLAKGSVVAMVHSHLAKNNEKEEVESLYGDKQIANKVSFAHYYTYISNTSNLYKIGKNQDHKLTRNVDTKVLIKALQ